MSIPRNEYPRPQLMRDEWINLNGEWEFEIDNSVSGKEKEFYNRKSLDSKIIVPFCPESKLSGIGNKDFMYCVWYRKDIAIPETWKNKKVILNFGAVDYKTTVYVNGEEAGTHCGGYTSFSFDITKHLKECGNYIPYVPMIMLKTVYSQAVNRVVFTIPTVVIIHVQQVFGRLYGWNVSMKTTFKISKLIQI